jgi:catechol 2,3-dioxygenase-like lactoylglutathione lyase family enzyme
MDSAMDMNQVTLPSTDVERSVAFFKRLGLALIVESFPDYARFELSSGHATLSVHRVDSVAKGHGVIVYFECDDLDDRVAALEAQGFSFEQEPTDQSWLWREAYLRDPDGNVLCLYRAGANRRFPPWRLP